MKKIVLILASALSVVVTQAQINIIEYQRQLDCNVNDTGTLQKVLATSPCGEVDAQIVETMFSGGCLGTLVRTYTFKDDCGNEAVAEQYILLSDTEAPTLNNVPGNTSYSSKQNIPKAPEVTATDNSGNKKIKVVLSEKKVGDTITRTWTAVDTCGNSSTATQTILSEDI